MKEDTYYSRNRERLLQQSKEYRERNKDYYNAYYETWYKENKDRINAKRNAERRLKPKVVRHRPVKEKPVKKTEIIELPVFLQAEVEEIEIPVIPVDPAIFTVKFD